MFKIAKIRLTVMWILVMLSVLISPVSYAVSAWEVESFYSDFKLNTESRQQILSANSFSDFDVATFVSPNSGQLVIRQQDFVLPLGGHFHFPLYRLYSRDFKNASSIGRGWRWAFDLTINKRSDTVLELVDFDGRIYDFFKQGEAKFENNSSGKREILITNAGYSYTYHQNLYLFDNNGKLQTITDHSGNVIKFIYQNQRLEKINLFGGTDIEFSYDNKNRLIQTQLPSGQVITYRYVGDLVTDVFDQYENHISYIYEDKYLSSLKLATKLILEVSESIKQTKRSVSLKTIKSYWLDYQFVKSDLGRADFTVIKQSEQDSVSLLYSCREDSCRYTDYSGATAVIDWHQKFTGLPVKYLSAQGRESRWQYNQFSKLIATYASDQSFTRFEYDDRRFLTSVISARGAITTYQYTNEGLLSEVIHSGIQSYRYSYNERGDLTAIRQPNGQTINIEYDANALPVALYLNLVTLKLHRDEYQRFIQLDIDKVPVQRFTYDNSTRSITYNNLITQNKQQIVYFISGLTASLSLPNIADFLFEYDAAANLAFIKGNDKNLYAFSYDHFDRLSSYTVLSGVSQKFEYDKLSRLTQVNNQANTMINNYSYDSDGLITEEQGINSRRIVYDYDSKARLSKVMVNELPMLEIEYNADNYPVFLKREGQEIKYLRDRLNRVKFMRIKLRPEDDYMDYEFTWNTGGQLNSLRYPSGAFVDYDYDEFGRINNISLNEGSIIRYHYLGVGKLKLDYPSGLSSIAMKNVLNRLNSLSVEKNLSLFNLENRFNLNGQLASSVTTINAEKLNQSRPGTYKIITTLNGNSKPIKHYLLRSNYKQDSENNTHEVSSRIPIELIKDGPESNTNNITRYKFDDFDRIKQIDYVAKSIEEFDYQFDRLIMAGDRQYSYDDDNKLQGITYPGKNLKISYNSLSQINKIGASQSETRYFYDGNSSLSRVSAANADTYFYNYQRNRLSQTSQDLEWRDYIYDPGFALPLAFVDYVSSQGDTSAEINFLHRDGHQSPVLITDSKGDIKNIYNYNLIGNLNFAEEKVENRIGYKSYFIDYPDGLFELKNPVKSMLYTSIDGWAFNLSVNSLELSKKINANPVQNVTPISVFWQKNCDQASNDDFFSPANLANSIVGLPGFIEQGLSDCHDPFSIKPKGTLNKALELIHAGSQAMFEKQMAEDFYLTLSLLRTTPEKQTASSDFDRFVNVTGKPLTDKSVTTSDKASDLIPSEDQAAFLEDENRINTITTQDAKSPSQDNLSKNKTFEPQQEQSKPETKRIWLIPEVD